MSTAEQTRRELIQSRPAFGHPTCDAFDPCTTCRAKRSTYAELTRTRQTQH